MTSIAATIMQRLDKGMLSYPVIERNSDESGTPANFLTQILLSFPFLVSTTALLPLSPLFGLAPCIQCDSRKPTDTNILEILESAVFRLHENFVRRKRLRWKHTEVNLASFFFSELWVFSYNGAENRSSVKLLSALLLVNIGF